jgi:hypothetical protein
MQSTTTSTIALALMLATGSAHAALSQCRPSPDCGSAGKPCNTYVSEGDTRTLTTSVLPGPSVIRVRVCTKADAICKDGADTQAVSVFGYAGEKVVYTRHLNANSGYDTGGNTELPALSKLDVRCSSATQGAYCLVAWQHCKESLPLKAPGS